MDSNIVNDPDDTLSPSTDATSLNNRPEPADTGADKDVPDDIAALGHPTSEARDDSPESLDQEITEGANREDIDPDHSIDRPVLDNIDEEEHGVN